MFIFIWTLFPTWKVFKPLGCIFWSCFLNPVLPRKTHLCGCTPPVLASFAGIPSLEKFGGAEIGSIHHHMLETARHGLPVTCKHERPASQIFYKSSIMRSKKTSLSLLAVVSICQGLCVWAEVSALREMRQIREMSRERVLCS